MSPNNCKRGWLLACANFHGSAVVVPKSIKCNDVMCDRSSLYSNCVEDADCASNKITSVNDFEPDADLWPFNPFTFNPLNTTLPTYSPCCNFYEKNCNGAGRRPQLALHACVWSSHLRCCSLCAGGQLSDRRRQDGRMVQGRRLLGLQCLGPLFLLRPSLSNPRSRHRSRCLPPWP